MALLPKTPRSFEEDGRLSLTDQRRRADAYAREAEAERDPETGERPSVADRVKGAVEGVAGEITSHLPHPKA